jgi:hypothetical protein
LFAFKHSRATLHKTVYSYIVRTSQEAPVIIERGYKAKGGEAMFRKIAEPILETEVFGHGRRKENLTRVESKIAISLRTKQLGLEDYLIGQRAHVYPVLDRKYSWPRHTPNHIIPFCKTHASELADILPKARRSDYTNLLLTGPDLREVTKRFIQRDIRDEGRKCMRTEVMSSACQGCRRLLAKSIQSATDPDKLYDRKWPQQYILSLVDSPTYNSTRMLSCIMWYHRLTDRSAFAIHCTGKTFHQGYYYSFPPSYHI